MNPDNWTIPTRVAAVCLALAIALLVFGGR